MNRQGHEKHGEGQHRDQDTYPGGGHFYGSGEENEDRTYNTLPREDIETDKPQKTPRRWIQFGDGGKDRNIHERVHAFHLEQ